MAKPLPPVPHLTPSGFQDPVWVQWLLQVRTAVVEAQQPPQYTTALAPPYTKGAWYFDTTLNKLRIGGATGWETVTSV